MIIDVHTHLFPEEVRQARGSFALRDPAFGLLYGNEKSRMASLEDLLGSMDREGVSQSVVCGFPWEDPGLCREGNDYLLHCAGRHPGRILPFACLPPRSLRQAARERDRCLARGARGIGEVAFYRGEMNRRDVRRLSSLLMPLSGSPVPLLLHVNEPVGHPYPGKNLQTLQPVYELLQRIPEVSVILAHWGGGFFFYELMPEVSRAARRVFYDTAASPFLYQPRIYALAAQIAGPDRILWGSDFPLISPSRYFREIGEAGLPPQIRERILGLNAQRLLSRK